MESLDEIPPIQGKFYESYYKQEEERQSRIKKNEQDRQDYIENSKQFRQTLKEPSLMNAQMRLGSNEQVSQRPSSGLSRNQPVRRSDMDSI